MRLVVEKWKLTTLNTRVKSEQIENVESQNTKNEQIDSNNQNEQENTPVQCIIEEHLVQEQKIYQKLCESSDEDDSSKLNSSYLSFQSNEDSRSKRTFYSNFSSPSLKDTDEENGEKQHQNEKKENSYEKEQISKSVDHETKSLVNTRLIILLSNSFSRSKIYSIWKIKTKCSLC